MPTPNEVELRIKAQNDASKVLDRLGDQLDELAESQKALSSSADLAKKSQRELVAQEQQLLTISNELNRTLSKVDAYKRQRQAVADLDAQLAKQRESLRKVRDELIQADAPSAKLKGTYRNLGAAIRETQAELRTGQGDLVRFGNSLNEAGIDATRLADAETRIADQQGRVSRSLDVTRQSAGRLSDAQREVAATAAKAAAEEKAAARVAEFAVEKRIALEKRLADARSRELGSLRADIEERSAEAALAATKRQRTEQAAADRDHAVAVQRQIDLEARLAQEEQRRIAARREDVTAAFVADDLERQNRIQAELVSRQRQEEDSLRRQIDFQERINRVVGIRAARSQASLDDTRAAFVNAPASRFDNGAAERQAVANQRILDINRRANEVEDRLRQTRERSTGVLDRLKAATTQNGAAVSRLSSTVDRARRSQEEYTQSQRTALSLFQRIRGQVLSVISAYVGLFGAFNLVGKSIDTVNERANIKARLLAANNNDVRAAADDYAFVRSEAERLGIALSAAGEGYARLRTAAAASGQAIDVTRFIYSSFAEVLRVTNADTETAQRVFRALDQIISKGTINAEDYKNQFGDALPAAMVILGRAIKKPSAELAKLQEQGKLTADFLLLVAKEYREQFGAALPAATQSLQAQFGRLKTAIGDFQEAFLDSAFGEELKKLIADYTKFLTSKDGAKFARTLGEGFRVVARGLRALIEALPALIDNLDLIGKAFALVVGAQVIGGLSKLVLGFQVARAATVALAGAQGVGGLAAALGGARIAGLALLAGPIAALLAVAATGITIAVSIIKTEREAISGGVTKATKTAADAAAAVASAKTRAELDAALSAAFDRRKEVLSAMAEAEKAFANQAELSFLLRGGLVGRAIFGASPEIVAAAEGIKKLRVELAELDATIEQGAIGIAELPADVASAVGSAGGVVDAEIARLRALLAGLTGTDKAGDDAKQKAAEQLAARQALLRERFAEQNSSIETDLAEAQVKSLGRATDIITAAAEERIRELENLRAALTKDQLPEFAARIDGLIKKANVVRSNAIQTATGEFATKDFAAAEAEVNKRLTERNEIIQTENSLRDAGLRTSREAADNIKTQVEQLDPIIAAALDKMLALARALKGPEGEAAVLRVEQLKQQFFLLGVELTAAEQQAVSLLANNLTNGFEQAARSVGDLLSGVQNFGEFFKSLGQITRQFFSQLLIDIGLAIARQAILTALLGAAQAQSGGGGGGTLGVIIGAISGLLRHDGGPATGGPTRAVDPRWFNNAVRYHDGGIVGLKSDEVPSILQKGEFVMSRGDPRNPLNGGGGSTPQNIQVVNTIDTESLFAAGSASSALKKTVLNIIRAERSAVRSTLA